MTTITGAAKRLRTTIHEIRRLIAAGEFPKPTCFQRGCERWWNYIIDEYARNHQPENPNENRNPQS